MKKENAKIRARLSYKGRVFMFSVDAEGYTFDQGFDYEFWGSKGRTTDCYFEADEIVGGTIVLVNSLGAFEVPVEKMKRYPALWAAFQDRLIYNEGLTGYEVQSEDIEEPEADWERY